MRVLAILLGIIQFTFAFHALRTGRGPRWIMIIILAPVIGCLAYYFMEVFPHSREERQLRRAIRDIARALAPDAELRRRAAEAETNASVDNRAALADECLEKGMFEEAIPLYEGCLQGPHARDAKLLFALARARFYNGQPREAAELLARLQLAEARFRPLEVQLLQARVCEALGDEAGALARYQSLRDTYVGFEAKYRLGVALVKAGRTREARELFEFIHKNARRSAVEAEQLWVRLARSVVERAAETA